MSKTEINLCTVMMTRNYGEQVSVVATYLLKQICGQPLFMICKNVPLTKHQVKAALSVLLMNNIVTASPGFRDLMEYSIGLECVLRFLFHPWYIKLIEERFGLHGQLLAEAFILEGNLSMSNAIKKVVDVLYKKNNEDVTSQKVGEIKSSFVSLVEHKILHQRPEGGNVKQAPPLPPPPLLYGIPEIKLYLLEKVRKESSQNNPDKEAEGNIEFPDSGIYWQLDFEKLAQYLRNKIIMSAVANSIDRKAAEIARIIFEISEGTTLLKSPTTKPPVSRDQIWQKLKKEINMGVKDLDPYLSVLTESEGHFLSKSDDRSGGMYVINIKQVLEKLAEETASSVIQERFGSKSSRIFRIILDKKYVEQKKLEEIGMISPKDAKDYTYKMLKESFVTTQDIAKTPDNAPSRTIYLFHVDMKQVSVMLLQRCYQAVTNNMLHQEALARENKRLLNKKSRVDSFIETLKQTGASDGQIAEMEEMITPPEQATLEKVKDAFQKLNRGVEETVETTFLLKLHLHVISS